QAGMRGGEFRISFYSRVELAFCGRFLLVCQEKHALRDAITRALLVFFPDAVEEFPDVFDLVEADARLGQKHHRFVLARLLLDNLWGEVVGELKLAAGQVGSDQFGFKLEIIRIGIRCPLEQRKRLPKLTLLKIEQPKLALRDGIARRDAQHLSILLFSLGELA